MWCGLAELFGACFDGAVWIFLKLCSMACEVCRVGGIHSYLSYSVVTFIRYGEISSFGN